MSDGGDWKAMYEAAKRGDAASVRHWLSEGVDPNFQHQEVGSTALIVAAERGHLEVVKALVEGGADPEVRSHWESATAAETAASLGRREIAAWLERRSG